MEAEKLTKIAILSDGSLGKYSGGASEEFLGGQS
jgi:hypothetical protein